jgi:photosystem II stability/assembly factor-like uncharacterized protein
MPTPIETLVSQTTGIAVDRLQEIKRRRAIDDTVLAQLDPTLLQRLDLRLGLPNLQLARLHYLALRHRDANGRLPGPQALWDARTSADALRDATPVASVAGIATGPSQATAKATWVERGPGNIGGRTRAIVAHPTAPGILYAGSVGGGIWQSTDHGQSWNAMDDKLANLAICCMAAAPNGVLYAGTGEGFGNADALRGAGIFVCPGGGKWFQLSATLTDDFSWVNRLAITTGQVILAATLSGMMRSTDDGQSWSKRLVAYLTDAKAHPTDPNLAVAGTRDGQAYYTRDAGKTWTQARPNPSWGGGRVELTYALAAPDTVYASVNNNGGEIWRSTDGGQTYTKRATLSHGQPASYLGGQGWYDNVIWAGVPNNADFVLVGGIDLWRSTDGGDSLARISQWWSAPTSAHADHHTIVPAHGFDGVTNKAVYFGNDGGLYRADNVLTVGTPSPVDGWTNLDNGYAVTQFYYGAGNDTSGQLVAGAQDNGTLSSTTTADTTWFSLYGGDGGDCAADQTDANTFYGEYVYLAMFRALATAGSGHYIDGQFWNGTSWQRKPAPYNVSDSGSGATALFIAPFVIDPGNANRLLGGGASLWRTNDAKAPLTSATGPQWATIKAPMAGTLISAIAIAPSSSDVVVVGYANGQVWSSRDATTTNPQWTKNSPSRASGRQCTSVAIDPLDTGTYYSTFGGYEGSSVFRFASNAWSNITPTGLAVPAHCLAIHPVQTSWLYLGTDSGLWVSDDSGQTWKAGNVAPTNCAIFDLFWMGTTLVVVTHGRGVLTVDLTRTFNPATASAD